MIAFLVHTERLQHFVIAAGVTTEVKLKAILLSTYGAYTYRLIHSLAPTDPND